MTSAILFEGPSLEEVLAEAEAHLGSTMVVEAANRVRSGGFLGFFAQERYEVWARPGAPVDPIAALLEETESTAEPATFGTMLRGALSAETDDLGAFGQAESRFFDDDPGLAAGVGWADEPEPQLSTAEVALTGDVIEPTPITGATHHSVAVRDRGAVAPPAEAAPGALVAEPTPAAVALDDPGRGVSVFEQRTEAASSISPGLLWAMLDRLESFPAAPGLPTAGPTVVAFVGEAAATADAARRLGASTGLWGRDIVVMSRRTDVPDVSPWMVVTDPDELVRRSARWHQRSTVTPVVIDQSIDTGSRGTAKLLTAIAADHVRMVVEAWRLPSEVGEVAARLGGVEAIELIDTSDAVEPLAMLDLEIPVASVEGRPATPALLAAVWLERRRRG